MNAPLTTETETPCDPREGCNCPDGTHKWEIEPHPYSTAFDTYVGDDDAAALQALRDLVENKWDDLTPGVEAVIKIRMNHE